MIYPEILDGRDKRLLLICDHASRMVPAGTVIPSHLLDRHVAFDIGTEPLTRHLSIALDAPAVLGTVSRLVIDLHRQVDHPNLVPAVSDGHAIPGNVDADVDERIARFHAPYHAAIHRHVRTHRPSLILSIHSFTPALESDRRPRPWQVGILYGRHSRPGRLAIEHLRTLGLCVGDNEPYSGYALNATLERHADANGIPSVLVEVRNDLIGDPDGIERWSIVLGGLVSALRNGLAL